MSEVMHYMSVLGATHAVPDIRAARYTDREDDVTCPVCKSWIES